MTVPRPVRGASVLGLAAAAALAVGILAAPQEAKAQCSVLDRHPCTPYFCGIHSGPGCIPDIFYPLNQDLRLRLDVRNDDPQSPDRDKPLDRLNEIAPVLSKCLILPPQDLARPGMQVTMRLGFSKAGKVLGAPRFTYITHEAPENVRTAYRSAATDMLDRCQPLPLSKGLGGAIAGRPFVISITDDRRDSSDHAKNNAKNDTKEDIHEHH
jgi:hypothetical protein